MSKISLKAFVSVLITFLTVFMLTACTTVEDNDPSTVVSSASTESATGVDSSSAVVNSSSAAYDVSFAKEYVPSKATDADGHDIELSVVYGTYFLSYGGGVSFDGHEFTVDLSAKGLEKGAVVFTDDSTFELRYNSGKTEICRITMTTDDDNPTVSEFTATQGDFTVIFSAV